MTDARLLVPLDGSGLAEHSLAYVPSFMSLGITHVQLLSVVEPMVAGLRRSVDEEARERNLLATYHREVAEDIRNHTGMEVESTVAAGAPAASILTTAEFSRPDYILISTHGASGLSRWRLGSVADKVIRAAECPTLVVGPVAAEREERFTASLMPAFKSILVPLDGSPLAEQALPFATQFAEAFGAQLHLVSVASVGSMGLNAAWAGVSGKLEEDLSSEAQAYLEQTASGTPGLESARLAVRFGAPAQALSDYVEENHIDLVIMTSHGRGGIVRTALGSTTDRLIGGAAPVLIVRPQPED